MNRLDRPATIDDGRDFFFDYIVSDLLGVISSRHLHTADLAPEGSMSPDCITLAALQCVVFFRSTVHRINGLAIPTARPLSTTARPASPSPSNPFLPSLPTSSLRS
jgi:hypothetical protein